MNSPDAPLSLRLPLHEWACLQTELIWIYDRKLSGPEVKSRHCVREQGNWAWYLRSGSLTFSHRSKTWTIQPGTWFMVPAGASRHEFSEGTHLLSIQFLCQWPSGENLFSNGAALAFPGRRHPRLEQSAVRLERLIRKYYPAPETVKLHAHLSADHRLFLRFQSFFLGWLENWIDAQIAEGGNWTRLRSGDDRPLRAARILNQAPLSEGFPLQAILKETGLSEVHLNRLFLAGFGLNPRKVWEGRRLAFAKNCLETSTMPVKEISSRLNFRADSHFATWFRRLSGKRPGEFRHSGKT